MSGAESRGSMCIFLVREPCARLAAAITDYAAGLGLTVGGLEGWPESPAQPGVCAQVTAETGTAEAWQRADLLGAYIRGLTDVLDGSWGNPPVTVGAGDLGRVLRALDCNSLPFDLEAAKSIGRLRGALKEAR